MKSINLGLAFVLELALLAAIAYWGSQLSGSPAVRWLVAIAAPAALALIWSQIAAPNARRRLPPAPLVAFKLLVFTVGAALLYSAGGQGLAIALEAVAVANLGLAISWRQV
jgi:Protein of unknown function (DUF2568)